MKSSDKEKRRQHAPPGRFVLDETREVLSLAYSIKVLAERLSEMAKLNMSHDIHLWQTSAEIVNGASCIIASATARSAVAAKELDIKPTGI